MNNVRSLLTIYHEFSWISACSKSPIGCSMIGSIIRYNFMSTCIKASYFDRIFNSIGTTKVKPVQDEFVNKATASFVWWP